MSNTPHKVPVPVLLRLVLATWIAIFCALPALAGIRASSSISNFINPATPVRSSFANGGIFEIAGGVLFHGQAAFYLETAGRPPIVIAPTAVALVADEHGTVSISYNGGRYRFDMHAGLACPLGRFFSRNGQIAYSLPPFAEEERLRNAGLVKVAGDPDHLIAKEFSRSRFVGLLHDADYDTAMTDLPPGLAQRLLKSAGNVGGKSQDSDDADSWLNMDQQVTYKVYLMDATKSVDIAGVPLRYYWVLDQDGAARVINVAAYSQDFSDGVGLTDFSDAANDPTQYDIVSLFQAAAVFRQVHLTNPKGFTQFVTAVCNRRAK